MVLFSTSWTVLELVLVLVVVPTRPNNVDGSRSEIVSK